MQNTTNHDFEAGYHFGYNRAVEDVMLHQGILTQAEVQTLTTLMAHILHNGQNNIQQIKENLCEAWEKCNPEDESTQVVFDNFSSTRTLYNKVRKIHKRFSEIQRKLKKMKS